MRNPTTLIFGGLAAVILLFSSIFIVNESQTAIVLNLGKVVRSDLKPGLHFKVPFIEQVRKFDRRLLTLDDNPERYLTVEKKDVEVDFFVKWRIKDVTVYYRATSGGNEEAAAQRLTPIIKNTLRNDINSFTLQKLVSGERTELAQRLLKPINLGAATLGIEVVDIRIKRINFPKDAKIRDQVLDRMRSERKQVANALRAEGFAESERIRAEAERESQVILADAQRDAQIFHRVVGINVQITHRLDCNVDKAVARHLIQHVVEEWQAGFAMQIAFAVEIHGNLDLGLLGIAFHCCLS